MTIQACILFTPEQRTAVMELNAESVGRIWPRVVDNPLANNLGIGTMLGLSIAPARLLNDPDYSAFYDFCSELPIRTLDSDVLFLPESPDI